MIEVHEDTALPDLELRLRQAAGRPIEAFGPVHERGAGEPAIEAVRPEVVGALERLPVPGPLDDQHRSMSADTRQGSKLPVATADDHERLCCDLDREVVDRVRHLVEATAKQDSP